MRSRIGVGGRARMGGLFVSIAACMVLFGGSSVASAAVRYAEPGTGGSNPACPQSNPCDIEEAVEMAAAGDEVIVLPGTYMLSNPLSVGGFGTYVHGRAGAPRPVIQTSGFTGVGVSNTGATVRRLEIRHTGSGSGLSLNGIGAELLVRSTSAFAGRACFVSLAARLRDSVCFAPNGATHAVESIMATFTNTLRLRNVTAVSGGANGIRVRAQAGEDLTLDVKSTIARGGGGAHDVRAETDGAASTTAVLNLQHSNYRTTSTSGAGSSVTPAGSGANQTALPRFVNAAGGDFHQAPGSPTIDAGIVDSHSGSLDLDGNPRTQGSAPDIGAFESPENDFTIGKRKRRKREKRKGTATIRMSVPGAGSLVLARTRKVKGGEASAGGPDPKVTMEVRPRGKAKRKLNKVSDENPKVKVRVKAIVTYTPLGGESRTKSKRVKLVKIEPPPSAGPREAGR